MSQKYSGGFITKSPVAPTSSAASGIWTLDQQQQAQQAGNWPSPPMFIEDLFSTYLYTGTGANQTIVNGVDLSGQGGLTWIKDRAAANHLLMTTAGGPTNRLRSNGQPSYVTSTAGRDFSSFNSNGFSLGIDEQSSINTLAATYVSWSFRKQPKFFDVVTWTGNGTNRTIAHNLGSVPGCIIIGATAALGTDWAVYHRSLANTEYLTLNSTAAKATGAAYWNSTTATSSVFSLGTDATVNYNTGTYIAYLFAHNAGGFGASATDNVISCGSYTGNGTAGNAVTLGFEPQWIMTKKTSSAGGGWLIQDVMRGMSNTGSVALSAQTSNAEADYGASTIIPTATGFTLPSFGGWNESGETFIYIAIRRGPMKTPTLGTSVFTPAIRTGTGTTTTVTGVGFPLDVVLSSSRNYPAYGGYLGQFWDRLRGAGKALRTPDTAAEVTVANAGVLGQDGYTVSASSGGQNDSSDPFVDYSFLRAPSFFDEVCWTTAGTSTNERVSHNLTTVPELIIMKTRSGTGSWFVYTATQGISKYGLLQSTSAFSSLTNAWGTSNPTSTDFGIDASNLVGTSRTMVAYLFATCAGVSKVGSYTGTGTTQTINCGFTAGARFVLIKRTDSTGDWYVWDSARGIVAGNDPYLLLNDTAAEVTGTDYIDTANSGFEISSTAPAAINASAGTYIFLAIA